ncbi:MAG: hypothetical protein QM572_12625 [Nocardioides sp.]|uniref:hypothetical protein n=1 Tax=Nocardioides sp. TaxID=35761 RepID=UPI0039E30F40
MLIVTLVLLVAAVSAYAAWPRLIRQPRERSLAARLRAIGTIDETLEHFDQTVSRADATLVEVRDVMVELVEVMRRVDTSLRHVDETMGDIGSVVNDVGTAVSTVDEVARRAVPLLATLERVATPVNAATRAARRVRRSGSGKGATEAGEEILDESTAASYGMTG